MAKRVIILVLDSLGIGATPDAIKFGDERADTFGHIADYCTRVRHRPLKIPHLTGLGLCAAHMASRGMPVTQTANNEITGAYGFADERSYGKDTPSGHWELTGLPVEFDWGYFRDATNSFPASLLTDLCQQANLPGVLGNCHASGTVILDELGIEHIQSGKPIVYTSADSVFQIAAHETHFGLERLYNVCAIARKLVDPYNIGRVIARPFIGEAPSKFLRTANRRDLSVLPHGCTLLDQVISHGGQVIAIGKIADIFAHQGITTHLHAPDNLALFEVTRQVVLDTETTMQPTLIFTNFVDFDSKYGHRRDVQGYAEALEAFDQRLPSLLDELQPDDVLAITADHGCDPTAPGSDHTRERVPVLLSGAQIRAGFIGGRNTHADLGQTLATYLGLPPLAHGESFLNLNNKKGTR